MASLEMKYANPVTEFEIRAWAIDPWNLDVTRCEIANVIQGSCSITEGYYSDTRISAEMQVLNPSFPDGSRVRIVAYDSAGQSEELGTFFVGSTNTKERNKDRLVTYTLHSTIWGISEDRCGYHWSIGGNTKSSTAIDAVCSTVGKEKAYLPGFNDYTSGDAVTYDIEDTFSSILFDICDRSNNRMDVDGHGRLTFGPYVAPSLRSADYTIDERSDRSIVLEDNLEVDDSSPEAYGRTVVVWKGRVNEDDEDDTEITSTVNVSASHPASSSFRGYTRTMVHQESDMSPATTDRATQLANQYMTEDSEIPKTGNITVWWCPIHEGNIIELIRMDGSSSRWLVQTIDADTSSWTKKLTLKEA